MAVSPRRDIYEAIADSTRSFVIAEIGSNHDGKFDRAVRLIDIAAKAGADAVKFQSYLADHLVHPGDLSHPLLKALEMPQDWYSGLKREAESRGMVFFSTVSNEITLGWLIESGVELLKIASPNLTHIPLIRRASKTGCALLMSTGLATLPEIDEAVESVYQAGNRRLALLHCVSDYPADPAGVNLRFMEVLRERYGVPVGFSDHTLGIGVAVGAVALGAQVIEKHLTLSRSGPGPDHHYSLEPEEFEGMVRCLRQVEKAIGYRDKNLTPTEERRRFDYRRSLHTARAIAIGEVLREDMIAIVRPADGLHPRHLPQIMGRKATRSLPSYAPLTWQDV